VKGIDTNILVYAHRTEMPFHAAAERCVRHLAEGPATWAIPWPCIHEFLAIVTSPRIFRTPSPVTAAIAQVEAWMESPSILLIGESSTHWSVLKQTIESAKIAGPMIHDARVAAICRQHGVAVLLTADRDFSRFRGLKCVNPLLDPVQ
jgi:toxin-antitoxin system PIN domain toxin